MKKTNCDACGKSLLVRGGIIGGMSLTLHSAPGEDNQELLDYMLPYQLDVEYMICFPCWLKALGVHP